MSRPRSLILVGPMGAGKSTVASALAHLLGSKVLDTDVLVSDQAGMTIAQIFDRSGELAFRALELHALERAMEETADAVVATGGGIVTTKAARAVLEGQQGVVFLDISVPVALKRIAEDETIRPLLGDDPKASLESLDRVRRALYEEVADLRIDVDSKSVDEIAQEIVAWDGVTP